MCSSINLLPKYLNMHVESDLESAFRFTINIKCETRFAKPKVLCLVKT